MYGLLMDTRRLRVKQYRSNHWGRSVKNAVKILQTLVLDSPFNKVAVLKTCNFIKKRLQHRCLPVKSAKFLRTPIFKEHLRTSASSNIILDSGVF